MKTKETLLEKTRNMYRPDKYWLAAMIGAPALYLVFLSYLISRSEYQYKTNPNTILIGAGWKQHEKFTYVIRKLADDNHDNFCSRKEMNALWRKNMGYSYDSFLARLKDSDRTPVGFLDPHSEYELNFLSEARSLIKQCAKTRPEDVNRYAKIAIDIDNYANKDNVNGTSEYTPNSAIYDIMPDIE